MIYNTANYKSFIVKDIRNNEFKMTYYNEHSKAKTPEEFVEELMGLASVARVMLGSDIFTRAVCCDEEEIKEIKRRMRKIKFRTYIDRIEENCYECAVVYNDETEIRRYA